MEDGLLISDGSALDAEEERSETIGSPHGGVFLYRLQEFLI
jgi:hypothetical protein